MGNIVNRVFDSSGPEGKVRGTPQQIIDKYTQLTRDAQLANDRINAENFQQHAEHYTRLLGEGMREMEARREQQEREQRERQRAREENNSRQQQDRSEGETTDLVSDTDTDGADSTDIVEPEKSEKDMLVSTPEEGAAKPPRAPRRRKPKDPPADTQAAPVAEDADTPEAAAE